MSKFNYAFYESWPDLIKWTNSIKDTTAIKKLKKMNLTPEVLALNIMGQDGWELVSSPIGVGRLNLIFKKKV